MIDQKSALIYTMVLVSAADNDMTDAELGMIGEIVRRLPIFDEYNAEKLPKTANACGEMLSQANGLEETLDAIREALPARLRETAYALACDIVAADQEASQEELRVLEMLRYRLELDRLIAAAIERGARARFATA